MRRRRCPKRASTAKIAGSAGRIGSGTDHFVSLPARKGKALWNELDICREILVRAISWRAKVNDYGQKE